MFATEWTLSHAAKGNLHRRSVLSFRAFAADDRHRHPRVATRTATCPVGASASRLRSKNGRLPQDSLHAAPLLHPEKRVWAEVHSVLFPANASVVKNGICFA